MLKTQEIIKDPQKFADQPPLALPYMHIQHLGAVFEKTELPFNDFGN